MNAIHFYFNESENIVSSSFVLVLVSEVQKGEKILGKFFLDSIALNGFVNGTKNLLNELKEFPIHIRIYE